MGKIISRELNNYSFRMLLLELYTLKGLRIRLPGHVVRLEQRDMPVTVFYVNQRNELLWEPRIGLKYTESGGLVWNELAVADSYERIDCVRSNSCITGS
jgi:hypothetical protein